jgi:hypothetical protein
LITAALAQRFFGLWDYECQCREGKRAIVAASGFNCGNASQYLRPKRSSPWTVPPAASSSEDGTGREALHVARVLAMSVEAAWRKSALT